MRTWLIAVGLVFVAGLTHAQEKGWKAGVAVKAVTPAESMWLAGYASRTKPAEGKEQDLFVKALAIEDPAGHRVVLLTSDLIGIPRSLGEGVAEDVKKKFALPRDRLMLTVSHTHCGPVVRDNLEDMYPMPPDEAKKIAPYAKKLRGWMTDTIVQAVEGLKPARLAVGKGTARFAVNRRTNKEAAVPEMLKRGELPRGPVDHDVPVLRVTSPDGKLVAVVFGYACHNTTMSFDRWCGDYAGYAQEYLEAKHKGAVAMFWTGCGGDSNPLPRRSLELCKKYGKELSGAVQDVLDGKLTPLTGGLATRYATVALPYAKVPGAEQLAADMLSKNLALRKRAERLKKLLDEGGKIDDYTHYPVQVWRLGDQVTWVALGGEVVVDYSLRLKKELAGGRAVWVAGYANDVMAYVPSERVLKEGGYEGDTSMIYYGLPSKWAVGVEGKIVAKALELAREVGGGR
jgi:hypothetical protein